MYTIHTAVAELQPYSVLASLTKQDALKIFVLGFFLVAEEMPFEFMAKASRMVKIEKEQISGIELKSTVPLFLLYPVCYEIQYPCCPCPGGPAYSLFRATPLIQ